MNPNKKVLITVISFVLAMVVIACSCSSLTPTPTAAPPPTVPVNPMPSLEGYWLDTDTNDVHVIEWQNGQYVVTAVNDNEYGSFVVASQFWNGSALTWTYQVSYNDTTVTFTTVSVSGDSLTTNWSNSVGDSGTETLQRVSSPIPPAPVDQEAMPGLAGQWQAPTEDVYDIAWQNGEYVVLSCIYQGTSYSITSQSWTGSSLTWSYYDTDLSVTVTLTTTSLSGDSLYINWAQSDGSSGTGILTRVQ
jgi:hypothetical protein